MNPIILLSDEEMQSLTEFPGNQLLFQYQSSYPHNSCQSPLLSTNYPQNVFHLPLHIR